MSNEVHIYYQDKPVATIVPNEAGFALQHEETSPSTKKALSAILTRALQPNRFPSTSFDRKTNVVTDPDGTFYLTFIQALFTSAQFTPVEKK